MEGLESSPFSGWVTSAPNIIVGISLTNGILQLIASMRTVFLPPIWIKKWDYIPNSVGCKRKTDEKSEDDLHYHLQMVFTDFITLTLIFKETLAKYCLLVLNTCFVRQHCDIKPKSVSHILLRSPASVKWCHLIGTEWLFWGTYWRNLESFSYHIKDHYYQGE